MTKYSSPEKEILIALGLKIRSVRLSLNLSQEELAEACGIHRTYVSSLERGERNISMLNLIKICKAINFPPEKILEGFYEPRLDK